MSSLKEVSKKSKKMGADAAMHKPFSMERFVNAIGLQPTF
jgi:hypothetical protein